MFGTRSRSRRRLTPEADGWRNKAVQGTVPASQKNCDRAGRAKGIKKRRERYAGGSGPATEHHGYGIQEMRRDEMRNVGRSGVDP